VSQPTDRLSAARRAARRELLVLRSMAVRLRQQHRLHRELAAWGDRGVYISPLALLRIDPQAEVAIGAGSSIGAHTIISVKHDPHRAGSRAGSLEIGTDTGILEFNNIRTGGGPIIIGNGCLISQHVSIIAENHDVNAPGPLPQRPLELAPAGVAIGDDVWVGAGAAIMPGVSIGDGAVVGAGAVVTHDVPPGTIVVGIPARPVGTVADRERSDRGGVDRGSVPSGEGAAGAVWSSLIPGSGTGHE
jgi:acetyltransferase-like isoleucine patch superfamily enzyme